MKLALVSVIVCMLCIMPSLISPVLAVMLASGRINKAHARLSFHHTQVPQSGKSSTLNSMYVRELHW